MLVLQRADVQDVRVHTRRVMIVIGYVDPLWLESNADDNFSFQTICVHSNRAWENNSTLEILLLLIDYDRRGDVERFCQRLEALKHL